MGLSDILFSFNGRINRGKFWWGYLVATLISLAIMGVASYLLPWDQMMVLGPDGAPVLDEAGAPQMNFENVSWGPAILFGVGLLMSMVMGFALMIKRCHDRGKSGWWSLIAMIPIVGGIWLIIDLGIMEGDEGPNQYGPNPLRV